MVARSLEREVISPRTDNSRAAHTVTPMQMQTYLEAMRSLRTRTENVEAREQKLRKDAGRLIELAKEINSQRVLYDKERHLLRRILSNKDALINVEKDSWWTVLVGATSFMLGYLSINLSSLPYYSVIFNNAPQSAVDYSFVFGGILFAAAGQLYYGTRASILKYRINKLYRQDLITKH